MSLCALVYRGKPLAPLGKPLAPLAAAAGPTPLAPPALAGGWRKHAPDQPSCVYLNVEPDYFQAAASPTRLVTGSCVCYPLLMHQPLSCALCLPA